MQEGSSLYQSPQQRNGCLKVEGKLSIPASVHTEPGPPSARDPLWEIESDISSEPHSVYRCCLPNRSGISPLLTICNASTLVCVTITSCLVYSDSLLTGNLA